jgi:tetratricopeptide (TPR) repeat protein
MASEEADRARNVLALAAPDSARMHQITAERFINQGDAVHAIAEYGTALQRDPSLVGVHYELGEALLEVASNKPDSLAAAEQELRLALRENPRNGGAEAKLGIIAQRRGDAEAARRYFEAALHMEPNELDALAGLAKLAADDGKTDEAIDYLKRAVEAGPLDEHLHYRLAELYKAQGDTADETKELTQYRQIKSLRTKTDLAGVASQPAP